MSLAVAGPLAEQFGVRFWYVAGGAVCVLMGSIALTIPTVVNAERLAAERNAILAEQAGLVQRQNESVSLNSGFGNDQSAPDNPVECASNPDAQRLEIDLIRENQGM